MLTSILLLTLAAAPVDQHPRTRDAGSISTIGRPTSVYGRESEADRVICLRNKVRRQNECRTRAEWVKVAEAMSRTTR